MIIEFQLPLCHESDEEVYFMSLNTPEEKFYSTLMHRGISKVVRYIDTLAPCTGRLVLA